jgi:hypothetical protein
LPETPADVEPVGAGKHDVENDEVVAALQRALQPFVAIVYHIDFISLVGEVELQ